MVIGTLTQRFKSTQAFVILDLGTIEIPQFPGSQASGLEITIQVGTDDAAGTTVRLYDLILIPVDEIVVDSIPSGTDLGAIIDIDNYMDVDDIRLQKRGLLSVARTTAADQINHIYVTIGNRFVTQANLRTRLYFFMMELDVSDNVWDMHPITLGRVQLEKQQRYLSMRGNR